MREGGGGGGRGVRVAETGGGKNLTLESRKAAAKTNKPNKLQ